MFGSGFLKNAWGGLIVSGDIYTYSHPHICIYIYIYTHKKYYLYFFILFYMVPTSGSLLSGGLLDVILLIWVCRSDTIIFNA